jgi:hypothetical protein
MSHRAPTFRQADLTRAIKGAVAAGLKPSRVYISEGKIVVEFDEVAPLQSSTSLDEWKSKRHARQA